MASEPSQPGGEATDPAEPVKKINKRKSGFYAVAVGRQSGVFRTWAECLRNVEGFPGSRYK
jgi:viroplasmin and RNaseH domain-containing protein